MKARLVVRITPGDVGSRVSIRSRIASQPGEPTTTDTVGRLLDWRDGQLSIQRRNGSIAHLQQADLLAGKVLPEMSREAKEG